MDNRWIQSIRDLYRDVIFRINIRHSAISKTNLTTANPRNSLESLSSSRLRGPVISAQNVTDFGKAEFVADPFLIVDECGTFHLFFEIYNRNMNPTAVIGHAESNNEGGSWEYTGVVLECDRHASYPYVFKSNGTVYMVPGLASTPNDPAPARLFRATSFPHDWEYVDSILEPNHPCLDTTIFEYKDLWWALVGAGKNDELYLYYNDSLLDDDWTGHPDNPVVQDRPEAGRPGGRPIIYENTLLIPLQDCTSQYGNALRVFEVNNLSTSSYSDSPITAKPVLNGQGLIGWNSGRMHHLDIQYQDDKTICVYDGDIGFGKNFISGAMWSIGFCSSAE